MTRIPATGTKIQVPHSTEYSSGCSNGQCPPDAVPQSHERPFLWRVYLTGFTSSRPSYGMSVLPTSNWRVLEAVQALRETDSPRPVLTGGVWDHRAYLFAFFRKCWRSCDR